MATRRSNVGTDQAWQQTQHIDPGDNLLTADGHVVEAGNLLWDTAHHAPAFDLTVDGIHTYHVTAGAEDVLVHNNDDGRCRVSVTESSVAHIEDRHIEGQGDWQTTSYFFEETDYIDLIMRAEAIDPIEQFDGRFARTIEVEGNIGFDRIDGVDTNLVTVITEADGTLVTAHPGVPNPNFR